MQTSPVKSPQSPKRELTEEKKRRGEVIDGNAEQAVEATDDRAECTDKARGDAKVDSEGASEDISEGATESTSEGVSEGASEGARDGVSKGANQGASAGPAKYAMESFTERHFEAIIEGAEQRKILSEDILQTLRGNTKKRDEESILESHVTMDDRGKAGEGANAIYDASKNKKSKETKSNCCELL